MPADREVEDNHRQQHNAERYSDKSPDISENSTEHLVGGIARRKNGNGVSFAVKHRSVVGHGLNAVLFVFGVYVLSL